MGKRKRNASAAPTKGSDDLSLDLSGIKRFFSGKKSAASKKDASESVSEGDEAPALDFSGAGKIFSRIPVEKAVTWGLLLALMLFVFWIHLLPAQLPVADDWASNSIDQNLRSQFSAQITQQFPNLPEENKNRLIDERIAQFRAENAAQLEQTQVQISDQFRDLLRYEGADGKQYTYLGDLDSYFWMHFARNWLETGSACDEITAAGCRHSLTLAPVGAGMDPTPELHVYAVAITYKFFTLFSPDYPLPAASFMLQALLGMLGVIPAFFIGRRLAGNTGGVTAALLIMLHPLVLSRSLGSDNDALNTTVFLFLLWMVIEAIDAKTLKRRIIFSVLSGVFVGVYQASWGAWWFIYLLLLIGLICAVGYHAVHYVVRTRKATIWKDEGVRADVLVLAIYYVASFVFVLLMGFGGNYFTLPYSPFVVGETNLDQAVAGGYWPNVLTTVAELNKTDINGAIGNLHGKLFFFGALLGIILMLLPRKSWNWQHLAILGVSAVFFLWLLNNPPATKIGALFLIALPVAATLLFALFMRERIQATSAIIVLIWFLGAIYTTYSGVRFILFIIPAFGIAFGVLLGRIYDWVSEYFTKEFNVNKVLASTLVFLIVLLALLTPVKAGYATSRGFIPSIDDGWWDALTKIKQESAPDAIINSWWDFGHWFKYVAERRVSADGTTQNTHVPRWLGLALVTSDERESVGVLRMLDCGSDAYPGIEGDLGAYGKTLAVVDDPIVAEDLVRQLVRVDRDEAEGILRDHDFTREEAQGVLAATHCDPPENYFITSGDMVGKAGVWAHFGLWNFTRAYLVEQSRTQPREQAVADFVERFDYTPEQAERIYYEAQGLRSEGEINAWVAPWPGYLNGWTGCSGSGENGTVIVCPIGIVVGQQPGGVQSVLEAFVYNASNASASQLVFGVYQNGQRLQQSAAEPATLTIAGEKGLSTIRFATPASTSFGMIYDAQYNRVMIADPALATSVFTQLFYLEGRYSEYYELFDDRNTLGGSRILTWKVDWDALD